MTSRQFYSGFVGLILIAVLSLWGLTITGQMQDKMQDKKTGVSKSAPPCHPDNPIHSAGSKEVAASTHLETYQEQAPKPHMSWPHCPDNMKMAFPSSREMDKWYSIDILDQHYDGQDRSDVEYSHTLCIPDSLGTTKK